MGNVSHGPSIVTDGLVLCLDNYNEQSYLGEPTTNLISNGDFETTTVIWTANQTATLVHNFYYNGRRCLKATMGQTGSTPGVKLIGVSVLANTTYRMTALMDSGDCPYVAMWNQNPSTSVSTTNTGTWEQKTLTFSTGSYTSVNLYFYSSGMAIGDSFYIDDVQLEIDTGRVTKFVNGTRSATDGWQDLSGNDNHADLTQLSYSATNVPGTNVNSFSFDGTNDYATFGTIDLFSGMSNMSFNAWVNIPSLDSGHHRIASQEVVYYFGRYGGNMSTYIDDDGSGWSHSSTNMGALSTGVSMLTWVKSGTTMHHYINGVSTGSTLTMPTTIGDNSNSNFIGSYSSNPDQPWGGDIDVIQAYDRDLSATEVLRNYNANKGRYGL